MQVSPRAASGTSGENFVVKPNDHSFLEELWIQIDVEGIEDSMLHLEMQLIELAHNTYSQPFALLRVFVSQGNTHMHP